jgi:rRNA maturation endonuclease Nob1
MELTLNDFVLFTLTGAFLLVVVFAVISRTLHARSESRSLRHRVVCRLCLHAFEDSSRVKVVECPKCGAANEKGRNRRLG